MTRSVVAMALCLLLGPVACVSQGKYDHAIQDAQSAGQRETKSAALARAKQTELDRLQERTSAVSAALANEEGLLKAAQTDAAALQKQLDDSVVVNANLGAELARLGKSASALSIEKGTLAEALDQAKHRLEELQRG